MSGLVLGLAIGALFGVPSALAPDAELWVPPGGLFGIGAIVAGTAGGWVLGPRAWRARSKVSWAGAILGLTVVAVLVGDLVVTTSMLLVAAIRQSIEPSSSVIELVAGLPILALFGAIVVGPFAVAVTFPAAVLWAIGMRLARAASSRWLDR